jgi:para-aminobenzoate synthetase component I
LKKDIIETLHRYLQLYKYALLTNHNSNAFGYKNELALSNQNPKTTSSNNEICFINYDYKNGLESFTSKSNNPLHFPIIQFIEIEKKINYQDIIFNENISEKIDTNIQPTVTKQQYISQVIALKQHIQQGDIYEINYCITFEAKDVIVDPVSLYQKLNAISNAPYAALAKFDKQYIISSSPELFLTKKENTLITKPIKGTAKRGKSDEEDLNIKKELFHNLKERTENVMIVDVARNDLSRLAKKGSVTVTKLCDIETYQQVHQMVSSISCELKENTTFEDILNATFPMASMTGAPKIRAMQLIDEYETYNRGPYSGALGYIDKNGDFDLSVLIRSIFYDADKNYLSFTVGSAITAMCNPEDEYEECLLKAKAMMNVLSE